MLAACRRVGVEVLCKAPVTGLAQDAESGQWRLRLEDGSEHASSCIASLAAYHTATGSCLLMITRPSRISLSHTPMPGNFRTPKLLSLVETWLQQRPECQAMCR